MKKTIHTLVAVIVALSATEAFAVNSNAVKVSASSSALSTLKKPCPLMADRNANTNPKVAKASVVKSRGGVVSSRSKIQ